MGVLKPSDTRSGAPKPRIFLVDDEPMLLELAERILEPLNYDVRTFSDPLEALRVFAESKSPPDLLITDYAMAGMNGMDLITECRRLHPRQKIILLSGTVDQSIYHDAPQKPDLFLAKPYLTNVLVETIQSLLAS